VGRWTETGHDVGAVLSTLIFSQSMWCTGRKGGEKYPIPPPLCSLPGFPTPLFLLPPETPRSIRSNCDSCLPADIEKAATIRIWRHCGCPNQILTVDDSPVSSFFPTQVKAGDRSFWRSSTVLFQPSSILLRHLAFGRECCQRRALPYSLIW